jgi:hypothetical protein
MIDMYSASRSTLPRNSYCPPAGLNCMTQGQGVQYFLDASQVSPHKGNKINLPVL